VLSEDQTQYQYNNEQEIMYHLARKMKQMIHKNKKEKFKKAINEVYDEEVNSFEHVEKVKESDSSKDKERSGDSE
jgi:mRNA-degrading endonuclease RelE of RelBE toxin-antitoxin system